MTDDLISIIVPVYNVEKYIGEAIVSVIAQSHTNWELLLVNDGSTDRSGDICQRYALNDSRIHCIDISNQGACVARNVGLKEAKGEYICFLDADDLLPNNSLKSLYQAFKQNGNTTEFDIVCGHFSSIHENGRPYRIKSQPNLETKSYYSTSLLRDMLMYRVRVSPWGRLFKRKLFEDIEFKPGLPKANDLEFQTRLYLSKNCKILFIPENVYLYRLRANSLSHKGSDSIERQTAVIEAFDDIFQNYRSSVENICQAELAHNILENTLWLFRVQSGKKKVSAYQREKINEYLPFCQCQDDWVIKRCSFICNNDDNVVNRQMAKLYSQSFIKEFIKNIARKILR